MTNSSLSAPRTAPQIATYISIITIVAYQVISIVLIFLRPDLDPSWHTISEWAIGPFGWLMSTGFLLSGVSYTALLVTLRRRVGGKLGNLGLALLAICALGSFGVGIFTTDPMTSHTLSLRGLLHIITGSSALILLPFAALSISLSQAARGPEASPRRWRGIALGAAPLFGFLCFVFYTAIFVGSAAPQPGPGVNIGWPPRFAFFTYMIWVIATAGVAIRQVHGARSNDPGAGQEGPHPSPGLGVRPERRSPEQPQRV